MAQHLSNCREKCQIWLPLGFKRTVAGFQKKSFSAGRVYKPTVTPRFFATHSWDQLNISEPREYIWNHGENTLTAFLRGSWRTMIDFLNIRFSAGRGSGAPKANNNDFWCYWLSSRVIRCKCDVLDTVVQAVRLKSSGLAHHAEI